MYTGHSAKRQPVYQPANPAKRALKPQPWARAPETHKEIRPLGGDLTPFCLPLTAYNSATLAEFLGNPEVHDHHIRIVPSYVVAREKPRHGLFSIPCRCFEVIVFARFRGFGPETLQFEKRNLRDSLSRRGVILCPLQGRRDSHEALSKATVGNGRSVPLAA